MKNEFKLSDSDKYVGELFSVSDLAEILEIEPENMGIFKEELNRRNIIGKDNLIDENIFRKFREPNLWKWLINNYGKEDIYNQSSFDEYILKAIIRKAYPNIEIEQQIKIEGRKKADFKITYNGVTKIIEYMGPNHFFSLRGKEPENPLDRAEYVKDKTGYDTIIWPYWIQRCERNVKAIFEKGVKGLGALWGTKYHFGTFKKDGFDAELIKKLTKQFNAEDDNGVGYFYERNSKDRNMQEHPMVTKIRNQKANYEELIPKGGENRPEF